MSSEASRRSFQIFLTLLGLGALIAGLGTALFGVASIVGAEQVSATVDSEMRFYAVWYAGAGAFLLRLAPRAASETATMRALAALLFIAGCSRGLSWLVVGRPHALSVTLMVIELSLPWVIVFWQSALARDGDASRRA